MGQRFNNRVELKGWDIILSHRDSAKSPHGICASTFAACTIWMAEIFAHSGNNGRTRPGRGKAHCTRQVRSTDSAHPKQTTCQVHRFRRLLLTFVGQSSVKSEGNGSVIAVTVKQTVDHRSEPLLFCFIEQLRLLRHISLKMCYFTI